MTGTRTPGDGTAPGDPLVRDLVRSVVTSVNTQIDTLLRADGRRGTIRPPVRGTTCDRAC